MTNRNPKPVLLSGVNKRKIELGFDGGNVTSDAGGLLLRQTDQRIGLTKALANVLEDGRRTASCQHDLLSLLRQRIYSLCMGYEDGNDQFSLRHDIGLQTAVGKDAPLASPPTISRFENSADQSCILAFNKCFVDAFLNAHPKPPKEIILDFDATDDLVHGKQENSSFRTYYDGHCFMPLYVFCGGHLLFAYLRPGNVMGYHNVRAVLYFLTKWIRERWPKVEIIFRADGDFSSGKVLTWCEQNDVKYITGMRGYQNLKKLAEPYLEGARKTYKKRKRKKDVEHFSSLYFRPSSIKGKKYWPKARRIIVKSRAYEGGESQRFLVTNIKGSAKFLYKKRYCPRGDMENRIKEQKLSLFSDRTSCSDWYANHFRVLLSAAAYVLMHAFRTIALSDTEDCNAQCDSIRRKFLRIGAVITRNTRRIRYYLASQYPFQDDFFAALSKLCPE